jgi:DNA polymerase (family 10)
VRTTPAPVAELIRAGSVRELRGIGPGIEARLRELVETGEIRELRELEEALRPELVGLARYLGISTSRMVDAARALGIETAAEFRRAAEEGRLRDVPGIGPKTEARLLEALAGERPRRGLLLPRARELTASIADRLGGVPAGDARRWCDVCESLAVVCPTAEPAETLDRFERVPEIVAIVEREAGRALGATADGVPVELVAAPPHAFGTALVRATGSPAYVEALGHLTDTPSEEELYRSLGIPWCPPELRDLPFRGEPPALLDHTDLRGDLHVHTTWSDGRASVLEMGTAARERGYEYLAICDHTPNVAVVPGLTPDDLRRQGEEIAAANERLAPFRVLRGVECDIRADGSLDVPDDALAELEWVQLSLHAGQRAPREELTARVTEAMRNPHVSALSHPQGRIVNHRPPNALDLARVFEVALENRIALEVNGLPDRLDLSGEQVRRAIDAGVSIVVSTDAHSIAGLANMELAVATARRGFASAADVVNTGPLSEVLARRTRT